jgi:hypothetical protein
MRALGWRQITNTLGTLYIPIVLCEVACTLGSATGIAGAPVLNTELFVTTITLTTGNNNVDVDFISPGSNLIGSVMLNVKGCPIVETEFAITASTTSMNCLYAVL